MRQIKAYAALNATAPLVPFTFQSRDPGPTEIEIQIQFCGICRVAQSNHVQPILLFLPTLNELADTQRSPVYQVKRAASQEFGAPLVDLTADLKPRGKELYLDADPVHLDAQGNAIVAERLFESFTNRLTR